VDALPPFEQGLIGQVLAGKYRLLEARGGGCFGVVFRAEQRFCGHYMRPVAVKVTRQTGLTEETAPHLFADALVLAQVLAAGDHEGRRHLVQIFDIGLLPEHEGRAFMVMEYVEGEPLLAHLRAVGRFSVGAGLRFLKQSCRALALVHSQGAVHRDLIPENILVDRRGLVRVVDFGLAAFTDRRLGFVPGATGVYAYMAPETLLGRSTPASDVYSLGLIMYEMFSGGGPHRETRWVTEGDERGVENHKTKTGLQFPPPSQFQNEIRNDFRWLDALIARCLDNEAGRRFTDAADLLKAVETCETGGELPPLPTSPEKIGPPRKGPAPPAPPGTDPAVEERFRDVRRLLAGKAFDQVIDRLDVYRPAEWATVDLTAARTLRALGQAYLGRGDLQSARECLEQLRGAQREQAVLPRADFAAALSDLFKVYRGLGHTDLAQACQEEARKLL
jgi:eukaryotic-like serine/threonine-protein kinase